LYSEREAGRRIIVEKVAGRAACRSDHGGGVGKGEKDVYLKLKAQRRAFEGVAAPYV